MCLHVFYNTNIAAGIVIHASLPLIHDCQEWLMITKNYPTTTQTQLHDWSQEQTVHCTSVNICSDMLPNPSDCINAEDQISCHKSIGWTSIQQLCQFQCLFDQYTTDTEATSPTFHKQKKMQEKLLSVSMEMTVCTYQYLFLSRWLYIKNLQLISLPLFRHKDDLFWYKDDNLVSQTQTIQLPLKLTIASTLQLPYCTNS